MKIENSKFSETIDIRCRVFGDEQGYPKDKIPDEYDFTAQYLAVIDDGKAVGCGRYYKEREGVFHIDNIALLPDARGGGNGKKLVLSLIEKCKENGAYAVTVNAKAEAVGFYIGCGFESAGEEFKDENFVRLPMIYNFK